MTKPDDIKNVDQQGSKACKTQVDTAKSQEALFKSAVFRVKELIMYAAEAGKEIEKSARLSVLGFSQKVVNEEKWTSEEEDKFWEATSTLSKELYPVTHTTLSASKSKKDRRCGVYLFVTITALLLVAFIWLQFVWVILNNVTTSIDESIKSKNSAILELNESKSRLKFLGQGQSDSPKDGESSVNDDSITLEENKRDKAQQLLDLSERDLNSSTLILRKWILLECILGYGDEEKDWDATLYMWADQVIYGLSAYVLPLICALLGSCAYILRSMLNKIRHLTFSKDLIIQYLLRLVLGALAGISIGWFFKPASTNLELVKSISPLALAFLAGYSVELLFTAMDKIISTFTETESIRKS